MAESVRELVVTLSMQAGNFNKTCTDINNQIKGVQAEFDAVTSGVDSWQTTMDGREAKLRALNETLALQQGKITVIADELVTAQGKLIANPGDLGATKKVADLENKLNNAVAAAANTKTEIEKLNLISLQQFSTKMTTLGTTLKNFGRKFSLYVGGPLAALGITSFNAFKDYEMAAAMLEGKLDGPKEDVDALVDAALVMSETIPVSFEDIMAIMTGLAAAGVPTGNIEQMTLAMAQLSAVTGMPVEQVSTSMVMFMNAFGLPLDSVGQLSSALVQLADSSIATESDIFAMATKMAATGSLAGFSATEILSLSAAFASMGIDAEAGGTAAAKLMKQFQLAAETGDNVEGLAEVVGVSADDFATMFKDDPTGLMLTFFDGLASGGASGNESVTALLDTLGLTEVRLSNLIAVGAANPDMFKDLVDKGAEGFEQNTALVEKAGTIFETTAGQMDILINKTRNAQADLGENVADTFQPLIDRVGELVGKFGELDEATQTRWVAVGGILIALGPVSGALGGVASGIGALIKHLVKVNPAMAVNVSTTFGSIGSMLGKLAVAGAAIWGIIELIKAAQSPDTLLTGNLSEEVEGVVAAKVAAGEATEEMSGLYGQYKALQSLLNDPENENYGVLSGTDVQKKTDVLRSLLGDELVKRATGMSIEMVAGGTDLSLFGDLNTIMTLLESEVTAAGTAVAQGTADGITAGTPLATDAAGAMATGIEDAFTGPLGIESPSTVMLAHGLNIDMGIAQGVLDGIPQVEAAMITLGDALETEATTQGSRAGAAYGAAFSSSASVKFTAAIDEIKRQLNQLEVRISRGYGS